MNEQKLCPLLMAGDPEYTPISALCRGDRCAWWDENRRCCAFALIAGSLDDISVHGMTVYN